MHGWKESQRRLTRHLAWLLLPFAASAQAQDGNLLLQPQSPAVSGDLTLENSSFTYFQHRPVQLPRELEANSIITVLVDYRTRIESEGDVENRKTANLRAVLADWVLLKNGNLKPSPQSDGDPAINAALRSQFRAEADLESRDAMMFRMAVRIVEIRPNGNLVLEGHQDIENNEERWQLSLTGIVPREAIEPDRTVRSDRIASLHVVKREMGHVRDGYNRGWLQRAYDKLKPF
jgi:flagellar L-ring protein precursor FlgH